MKNTMLAGLLLVVAATAGPTVAGCSVAVRGQEVYLRTDPRTDSAQLLVIYKGITATDEKPSTVTKAMEELRPYTSGERRLQLYGYGTWNLEGAAADNDDELADVAHCVALAGYGLFLDGEGRLCGYQDFRIDGVQYVIECLNDLASRKAMEELSVGDADDDFFDARTTELWLERARAGGRWFTLDEGELLVDLPMTPGAFDRMQGVLIDVMTAPADADDAVCRFFAQHFVYLRGMSFEDERLLMRFGVPGDRPVRLLFGDDEAEVHPQLREALEDAGVPIDYNLTLEDVRRRVE